MIKRFLVVLSLLAIATTACGNDPEADRGGSGSGVTTLEVSITDTGCEPAEITSAAGPTTFHVTNTDAGAVTEFEVLDGDRILGEAENVTPGLEGQFTLTLDPGTFETYCPGGSSERGTLIVTGEGELASPGGATGASADVAVATYRTYIEQNAATLVSRTNAFVKAVQDGYSFTDGIDPVTGELDAGLFFICFQRDPREQFVPIQRLLAENDALNEYIKHVGSGLFAIPPGVRAGGYIGETLLAEA